VTSEEHLERGQYLIDKLESGDHLADEKNDLAMRAFLRFRAVLAGAYLRAFARQ
jgi:hypothetical protein